MSEQNASETTQVSPDNQDAAKAAEDAKAENKVSVDRSEYEGLKAQATAQAERDKAAQEDGFADYDDYVKAVEEKAMDVLNREKQTDPAPASGDKTDDKSPEKTDTKPNAVPDDLLRRLEVSDKRAAAAYINAQWAEFRLDQAELPKEQRVTVDKEVLQKMVLGPEASIIAQIAEKKFNGNLFTAASYVHALNEGIPAARAQGAAAQAAIDGAAESSQLGATGATKEPDNLSPEEKAAQAQKEAADAIAPDDPPYEPPK